MSPQLLLISILATFCNLCWAGMELGIGMTHFGKHGDGVWYQKDYGPYDLKVTSPALSIGWVDSTFGLGWRVGYKYFGQYSTKCECTSSDRAYEQLQSGNDVGWPASTFWTKGDVHGAYASILPEWGNFYGELGVLYAGASNKVQISNWRPAIDETFLKWGEPVDLAVDNGRKWSLSPVIGVGYRFNRSSSVALTATRFNVKGEFLPIIHGPSYTLEFRHEF